MTDIVYIVGDGAKDIDDRPLRWSLRSLAKHARNVGRVIVVGHIPDWLSAEVVKVPNEAQWKESKHWNILDSEIKAVRTLGLDEPFLYSSDDHYLVADADMDAWPRYCKPGELPTEASLRKKGIPPSMYTMSLLKTRNALSREGLAVRRYPVHLNTWMDPALVDDVAAFVDKYRRVSVFGLEPQSIWGSLWEKRNPDAKWTAYAHDGKVRRPADVEAKIAAGLPAFSTTDSAERDPKFVAWMDARFPDKSKWEK